MNIEKVMSKKIVTVKMDDPLKEVKRIFDNSSFHHLLVVESEKLVGVVSDRDLLKFLSPNIGSAAETVKDSACLNKRAHQIMTRKPVTLEACASIFDAIDIFNNNKISCIPIIDGEQKPVGIISWRDILKLLQQKHPTTADHHGEQSEGD